MGVGAIVAFPFTYGRCNNGTKPKAIFVRCINKIETYRKLHTHHKNVSGMKRRSLLSGFLFFLGQINTFFGIV